MEAAGSWNDQELELVPKLKIGGAWLQNSSYAESNISIITKQNVYKHPQKMSFKLFHSERIYYNVHS